jgi:hypothetical protein
VIHVDVPRSWQKLQSGWWEFGDSMMIYVSGAQKHVDVTSDVLVNEWPYRTTVAWSEHDGWCVLELCEKIFDIEERCKPIGQPYKNLLTIVTKNVCTIDQLGMVLNEQPGQQVQGGAQSSSSSTVAQAPQDVQMSDALQPHATDAQRSSEIPVTINATGGVQSAGVTIAGITVTPSSSIALLRASCKYLEISQSGSKSKLWNRIIGHLDKLKILEEVEIMQSSLQESARNPFQFRQQRSQMMRMKSNDINLPTRLMQLGVNPACKGKDVLKDMRQIQVDFKIESFQVCHLILHTLASLVNQWMLIQQLQN